MPDQILSSFLADRDCPCPGCGYNLRGCTTGTCPECNAALALTLANANAGPRWPWLPFAAATAFAVCFGWIIARDLLPILFVRNRAASLSWQVLLRSTIPLTGLALGFLVVAIIAFRAWRRRRGSLAGYYAIAFACAGLALLFLVDFLL